MATTAEANKAVIRRLYEEVVNQGKYDLVAEEITSPDAVMHDALFSGHTGAEVIRLTWRALHESFSELHFTVEEMVAEGDLVAVRGTMTGTHSGTFRDRQATGGTIALRSYVFYRLRDGLITEIWPLSDQAGLRDRMEQLSRAPGKAQEERD
ncbi:ester cyclase (plasmid) [Streptomyces sp. CG1]|uniref:ester cyclase n=1 Tax=Streptomyces sp. CG1 TaxID=1287523 RepID=UPI0034E2ECB7